MTQAGPELPRGEDFLLSWHSLVAAWRERGGPGASAATVVLRDALDRGLPPGRPGTVVSPEDAMLCEIELVRLSGAMDVAGYLRANPGADKPETDAAEHFCRRARFRLFNPSLDFDVWWYVGQYLDPADDRINPLVHHLLVGRALGLPTLPQHPGLAPAQALPLDRPVRRAALVAGYDVDGVVDDYVVAYLEDLARFADVFYLFDGELPAAELQRLEGVTVGRWAQRHGEYDFGSWSRLARELVGWDRLEGYDEVLLANDSVYPVRRLDDVFATMQARSCDWWGMQLTSRHLYGGTDETTPVPMATVRENIPRAVWHYDHYPHVGSYFLAFRGRVLRDEGFRRHLERVTAQAEKNMLIYKYETGTTFYLVGAGYSVDTYVADLHPYHPVYSPTAFDLIGEGYPFVKRAHLVDNPYDTPDLVRWKERVLEHVPDAPVEMLERNLLRVAADDKLQRSFAILTGPDGTVHDDNPLRAPGVQRLDARTPTFDHWWAFPVCAYDHTFAGNERAVFEAVRDDPSIKKVVLTRSRRVVAEGVNVEVAPLLSRRGQELAARCGQVFVKHSPHINVPYPLSPTEHNFVNLWHGIPLKRFGWAAVSSEAQREGLRRHHGDARAVITSSHIDALAMSAAFFPLELQDMWVTGLPRNDFVVCPPDRLPDDLHRQQLRLEEEVGGRRLLMFLPTFKDGQADSYYRFAPDEVERLRAWCHRHDAVIGVREHMADRAGTYARALASLDPIDLSSRRYPDLEVLYRAADALLSDYSSCLVDFMLTGKPVVSFAYDLDRYSSQERGLFYDLEEVLPGPVCRTFEELSGALDRVFEQPTPEQSEDYAWRRSLFFDHLDDQASWRVVTRVKGLYVRDA